MRAEVKLQTARESGPESPPDVVASPMIQALRKELVQPNSDIAEESPYSTVYKLKALNEQCSGRAQANGSGNEPNSCRSCKRGGEVSRKKEAQLTQSFQEMESQLGDTAHSGLRLVLSKEAALPAGRHGRRLGGRWGSRFPPRRLRSADPPGLGDRGRHRHPGIRVPTQGVTVARSAAPGLPGDRSISVPNPPEWRRSWRSSRLGAGMK